MLSKIISIRFPWASGITLSILFPACLCSFKFTASSQTNMFMYLGIPRQTGIAPLLDMRHKAPYTRLRMEKAVSDHLLLSGESELSWHCLVSPDVKTVGKPCRIPIRGRISRPRSCLPTSVTWAFCTGGGRDPWRTWRCSASQPPSTPNSFQAQLFPGTLLGKVLYSFRHLVSYTDDGKCVRSKLLLICCFTNYFPRSWPGFKVEDQKIQNPGQLRPEFSKKYINHDSGNVFIMSYYVRNSPWKVLWGKPCF